MTNLQKILAVAAVVIAALLGAGTAELFMPAPVRVVTFEYVVKPGDTFWSISEKFRELDCRNRYIFDYQDELRADNPFLVERRNQLQPGDVLTIRYMEEIPEGE